MAFQFVPTLEDMQRPVRPALPKPEYIRPYAPTVPEGYPTAVNGNPLNQNARGFTMGNGSQVQTPKPNFQMRTPGAQVPRIIPRNPPALRPVGQIATPGNFVTERGFTLGPPDANFNTVPKSIPAQIEHIPKQVMVRPQGNIIPSSKPNFTMGPGSNVVIDAQYRTVPAPQQIGYTPGPAGAPPVTPKVTPTFGPQTSGPPPVQPKVTGWADTPRYNAPQATTSATPAVASRMGSVRNALGMMGNAAIAYGVLSPAAHATSQKMKEGGQGLERQISDTLRPAKSWDEPISTLQHHWKNPFTGNVNPAMTASYPKSAPQGVQKPAQASLQQNPSPTIDQTPKVPENGQQTPSLPALKPLGFMRDETTGKTITLNHDGSYTSMGKGGGWVIGDGSGGHEVPQQTGSALPAMGAAPQAPDYQRIYRQVTGALGQPAMYRWDEKDKIQHAVDEQYKGALHAYQTAMGGYTGDQTARAHMYGSDKSALGQMYAADQGLKEHMYDADSQERWRELTAKINADQKNAEAQERALSRKDANDLASRDRRAKVAAMISGNNPDKYPEAYQSIEDSENNYANDLRFAPGTPSKESAFPYGYFGKGHPAIPEKPGSWIPRSRYEEAPDAETAQKYLKIYGNAADARNAWRLGVPLS